MVHIRFKYDLELKVLKCPSSPFILTFHSLFLHFRLKPILISLKPHPLAVSDFQQNEPICMINYYFLHLHQNPHHRI